MDGKLCEKPAFARRQSLQLWLMQHAGFCLISLGRTLRWESKGNAYLEEARDRGQRVIFAFWHNRIVPSTWYWRNRRIAAMTSMSFDGEYIARFLRMFGYTTVRGSSSRNGLGALVGMGRCLAEGCDVAFTVDGPRGPLYHAKAGPVILAKRTGCPILCFHISAHRYLQLNSWDRFQIPAPFSRALVLIAPLIWVPPHADLDLMRAKQHEMQQTLDRLRVEADGYWRRPEAGRDADRMEACS